MIKSKELLSGTPIPRSKRSDLGAIDSHLQQVDTEGLPFWGLSDYVLERLAEICDLDQALSSFEGIPWTQFCLMVNRPEWSDYSGDQSFQLFSRLFYPLGDKIGFFSYWQIGVKDRVLQITLEADTKGRNVLVHTIQPDSSIQPVTEPAHPSSTEVIQPELSLHEFVEGFKVQFTPEFLDRLYQLTGMKGVGIDWSSFCALLEVDPVEFSTFSDHALAFHGKIVAEFGKPDYHGTYVTAPTTIYRNGKPIQLYRKQQYGFMAQEWYRVINSHGYEICIKWPKQGMQSGHGQLAVLEVRKYDSGNIWQKRSQAVKQSKANHAQQRSAERVISDVQAERDSFIYSLMTKRTQPNQQRGEWLELVADEDETRKTAQPKRNQHGAVISEFTQAVEHFSHYLGSPTWRIWEIRTKGKIESDSYRWYDWRFQVDNQWYVVILRNVVATKQTLVLVRALSTEECRLWEKYARPNEMPKSQK